MADQATDVKELVVAQDTTAPVPSTEENKAPDTKTAKADPLMEGLDPKAAEATPETDSKTAKTDPAAKTADDTVEADDTDETAGEKQPGSKAEERKQQLNTEIRDLVSQRNQLRAEVEKANAQAYQPATEEQLVDEGMTELEAKVEAMRQQGEVDKYNSAVADAQLTIESESQRVLIDFPIFDTNSPQYQKEIADAAAELLQENLIIDPNTGQVIGSNVSPYKLYKTIAAANNVSAIEGQIKGQRATEQMLSRSDSPSSAAPKADTEGDLFKKGLLGETNN